MRIERVLEASIAPDKARFEGVFAKDQVPDPTRLTHFPCCFVANSDPSTEKGTHWLAFYYPYSSEQCEFFDSYAMNLKSYGFGECAEVVKSSDVPLQSLNSSTCGEFCIYYLNKRSLAHTFDSIVNSFSRLNTRTNDLRVKKHVSTLIPRPAHLLAHRPDACQLCKPYTLVSSVL